jgi:hypothetical protein
MDAVMQQQLYQRSAEKSSQHSTSSGGGHRRSVTLPEKYKILPNDLWDARIHADMGVPIRSVLRHHPGGRYFKIDNIPPGEFCRQRMAFSDEAQTGKSICENGVVIQLSLTETK